MIVIKLTMNLEIKHYDNYKRIITIDLSFPITKKFLVRTYKNKIYSIIRFEKFLQDSTF